MNRLLTLALSLMLVFFAACAEEGTYDATTDMDTTMTMPEPMADTDMLDNDTDYAQWDADADDQITEAEFADRFGTTGAYGEWDMDASGSLNEEEFAGGWFNLWDENEDTYLDENEWNTWSSRWADGEFGAYDEWDADADDRLSQEEFRDRFVDTGIFDDWDLDSTAEINEEEFTQGVFGTWDEDRSGYLVENEWNTWSEGWWRS